MAELLWEIGIVAAILAVIGFGLGLGRKRSKLICFAQARHGFHVEREWLEAKFIQRATADANSDALRWADCMFDDDVAYVRNRATGELSALVAVTVAMDASDCDTQCKADVIGNLQAGTAVFRFDGCHWATDGRAILNLSPRQTIQHFHNDIEMVGEEPAHPSV